MTWETFTDRQSEIRCGTPSGFSRHQRRGEKPCDACAAAKRAYDQRRRLAPEPTKRNRDRARAQGRAETRLKAMYPDDYARLYAEEKARIDRDNLQEPA